MREFVRHGVRYRWSLLFPALVTALLIIQPEGMAVAGIAAAVLHECGHLAAMVAVGTPPRCCTLGAFGMRIEMDGLPGYGRNIAVSAAGPAVNLLVGGILTALGSKAATAHFVLGIFNLLPAAALDGGEILRCVLGICGKETAAPRVLAVLSAVILLPIAALALALFLHSGNATLLIVCGYLTYLAVKGGTG